MTLPSHARAVIVGGGIMGCSVAYHLARLGWREVVLLERERLTSGSTFHAAGLVGQLRANANITQLLKYSVELYDRLEGETGQATGWKQNGGLRLACTPERLIELQRQATTARSFGLAMHQLSPAEAGDLFPPMVTADLVGAVFLPTDGQANPSDITQALARGARQAGVTIVEDCAVTAFQIERGRRRGRVTGVETSQGAITCEVVVLAAGQWTRALGALAGVTVPLTSVQHQYLITESVDGVTPGLPTLRDPDRLTYFKEEVGGLAFGGYEPDPRPWAERGIPEGFHFQLLQGDFDHFEPMMQAALARVPALATAGVKELINGPEILHPRWQFHPRPGARAGRLLRRLRLQRFRHRRRRWCRQGAGRVDRRRRAAPRPLAGRHPSLRRPARRSRLGPGTDARTLRQALHHRLAGRGARKRPAAPPLAPL